MDPAAKSELTNSLADTDEYIMICESTDNSHRLVALEPQQNNKSCDILLFGEDSGSFAGIKAHKVVLASASPYLDNLFESEGFTALVFRSVMAIAANAVRALTKNVFEIGAQHCYVEQIDHTTLRTITDFVYTGTLRLIGTRTFVEDRLKLLLSGAAFLQIPELVRVCGKSLSDVRYLNSGCAVSSWLLARTYHCKVLEEAAVRVISPDLRAIATQSHYLNLKNSDVVILLKSLALATPVAASDLIFDAAVAWIGFKDEERNGDSEEVMRQIPLTKISAGALQRASEKNFLSEHVILAVSDALAKQIEIDELRTEKSLLTANLNAAAVNLATTTADLSATKDLAETRRVHLEKMVIQATELEKAANTVYISVNEKWYHNKPEIRSVERSKAACYVLKI